MLLLASRVGAVMVRAKPWVMMPPLRLKTGADNRFESMKLRRLAAQVLSALICCW